MDFLKMFGQESIKLDRMDGLSFTRWRDKMKFLLTAHNVYYVLEPDSRAITEIDDADIRKRAHDNMLCRGYILTTLTDRLYDLYSQFQSAKETWDALETMYNTEKQGADKFIIFNFFEFNMTDEESILDQVHKFLVLVSKIKEVKIDIPERLLVGAIIAKLPQSWHNYRKKLMHTTEDFNLEQIQKHLKIEEETRSREKNLIGASTSKVNHVESGKTQNKKRKAYSDSHSGNKKSKKPLSEIVCYNCKEKGHMKRHCPKKKNQNSNKKTKEGNNNANMVEEEDITEITTMISELHVGMIQELHMASVITTTDWWYDSGATTHVCNNKALFKTYEEAKYGHEVMMGDHHTSKVAGKGNVEIEFTSGKKLTLVDVLHVPSIRKNLVSGFKICKGGIKAVIESDQVVLSKKNVFVGKAYACDGMFKLNINKVASSDYFVDCNFISNFNLECSTFNLWHNRLAHINYRTMKDMSKQ